MIPLNANANVDNSDLVNYPDGRLRDNDGTNNGTGVNRNVYGDLHSNISKLMRLYAITPNVLPDNETNDYQIIEALRGLASKNDFIYPLSTNGTILNVDIKLSQMLDNEFIVCLAAFNKGSETEIKGIGAATFLIAYSGAFKANEYVRVIKTSGGVSIIRLADALSLDAMVADASFLKKASQAQENAGAIDTVATTPLVNKVTYTLRTIGADSINYLATAAQNGLYPKEHYSIVSSIGASPVKNAGTFSGLNVGSMVVGTFLAVSGDIGSAQVTFNTAGLTVLRCTMDNAMDNNIYKVDNAIESQAGFDPDSRILNPTFTPVNTTQFDWAIRESSSANTSLKVHISVTQL